MSIFYCIGKGLSMDGFFFWGRATRLFIPSSRVPAVSALHAQGYPLQSFAHASTKLTNLKRSEAFS